MRAHNIKQNKQKKDKTHTIQYQINHKKLLKKKFNLLMSPPFLGILKSSCGESKVFNVVHISMWCF